MVAALAATCVAAIVAVLGVGATAFADPAGPTDYRSEITSIEPATPTIEVEVLGGDSFVQLKVDPGTEVTVIGYRGEEYLWFQPDGSVLENQNSPSTYTNDDRYGGGEIPANATPDADPDWERVASGGQFSWHDHRAHWMQTIRPAGAQAGDQILEDRVLLVVDGVDVDVTVISTWLAEPSPLPAIGGVAVGLAAAASGWVFRRSHRRWAWVAAPVSALALAVGLAQYLALPSETGPRLVWWLFPAVAVVAVVVGAVADRQGRTFVAMASVLVAGVQLAMWGFVKRDGITAAIVPTDAPGWLDRLTTAAALVGGLGFTALALVALFDQPSQPAPDPS